MKEDYPPEFQGFHAKNFFHVGIIVFFTFSVGGIGFYRQEKYSAKDDIQTTLIALFILGLLTFMGAVLYKALISIPSCPKCNRKMKEIETVTIVGEPVFGVKPKRNWRIIECRNCQEKHRIPGLS
ncbi:MAG: hypothetical protein ACON4O_07755 [Lentimonas sp.]